MAVFTPQEKRGDSVKELEAFFSGGGGGGRDFPTADVREEGGTLRQ